MPEYRIYTILGVRPHYSRDVRIIHCDDDSEAIQAAERYVDFHDVELWKGGQFITRFHPVNFRVVD